MFVIATRRNAVSVGDMDSLENEFRNLDVCQSNQQEDISNRPEPFAKNTAGVSLSPLDLFIRDLDERKGKLPCCQEVNDIQTSVERFLKSLLLEVEKELPFYKTTLVKSGSFYEATKVGQPDEFDYFVQLDNFSRPEDIRFEELPPCMVAVIPSDSAFEKFIKSQEEYYRSSRFICSFQWKRDVKSLFIDTLNSILAQKFVAFGFKASEASPSRLNRHGPAYTLQLEWDRGQLYKGLIIKIDLSIAVKINSHSSTMAVDFESGAGRVVKSLLDASPAHYFAVSGYTYLYTVPLSKLFKELEETREHRIASQSDCLLRCSQSCLEQSLFRDHFGPNGGPSVCLRVLKVLRDMTRLLHMAGCNGNMEFDCKNGIDETTWEFITTESVSSNWQRVQQRDFGNDEYEPNSTRWISSYALKTLVLFEWSENPEDEQWTGINLSRRVLNIVICLLLVLKGNEGLRSFWYKDYNVLPDAFGHVPSEAINRVTIILRFLLSLDNKTNEYSFEQCIQNLTTLMVLASQKLKVTSFLQYALQNLFHDKIEKVMREVVGERKKRTLSYRPPKMLRLDFNFDFFNEDSVFVGFYMQALLCKIAPEEELILSDRSGYKNFQDPHIFVSETECLTEEEAKGIVKKARELFQEIARERMNALDNLPDYSLWSGDFKPDEMTNLLKLLCENFKKDLEILWNKICNLKEEAKTTRNVAET